MDTSAARHRRFLVANTTPLPTPPHITPFKTKKTLQLERGLVSEINNGRLAMIGIFGFMAEQKIDGAVPLLKGVVPHYSGEFMAPF